MSIFPEITKIPEIDAISHQSAIDTLCISRAGYSRYLSACNRIASNFNDWDYVPGSKSLSISAFKILQIYQQLVSKFGVQYAIENLPKTLENHGYQKTDNRNHQSNNRNYKGNQQSTEFTDWVQSL